MFRLHVTSVYHIHAVSEEPEEGIRSPRAEVRQLWVSTLSQGLSPGPLQKQQAISPVLFLTS